MIAQHLEGAIETPLRDGQVAVPVLQEEEVGDQLVGQVQRLEAGEASDLAHVAHIEVEQRLLHLGHIGPLAEAACVAPVQQVVLYGAPTVSHGELHGAQHPVPVFAVADATGQPAGQVQHLLRVVEQGLLVVLVPLDGRVAEVPEGFTFGHLRHVRGKSLEGFFELGREEADFSHHRLFMLGSPCIPPPLPQG